MKPGQTKKFLRALARIALAAYVGLTLFLYLFQEHFQYQPSRELIGNPKQIGLAYEDARFTAADGAALTGWYVPADSPRGAVLFCHSNFGNISFFLNALSTWHGLGYNVLIFDYRGYGASPGQPTEAGTYADTLAAWDYLVKVKQTPPDQIIVVGRSLGGANAAWLAQTHPPRALILESAFTSFLDLAVHYFPYLPVRLIARYNYNMLQYLKTVRCPILIVHSRDDEIVPFAHGERLFAAAPKPKQFLEISGDHNDGYLLSGRRYEDGLRTFLDALSAVP